MRASKVPSFRLYGEASPSDTPLRLHIEDIQARSRRYQWEIAAHTHRGLYQCLFLESGPAEVSVDGQRSQLVGPAIVLLPPGAVHAFHFDASSTGVVLTLAQELLQTNADAAARTSLQALFAVPHVLALADDVGLPGDAALAGRLQRLLGCLREEFRRPDAGQAPICASLAGNVLWLIGQALRDRHEIPAGAERAQPQLARFNELLDQHHAAHWPVARYARALGLSARHLNRLAVRHGGASAHQLLQQRLLREARRRLIYVAMPVSEIARELGFRDPAYFCRFFRRHTGQSPRRFRAAAD